MVKCDYGHFYDPDKNGSCPYCRGVVLDLDPSAAGGATSVGERAGSSRDRVADKTIGADVFVSEGEFDSVPQREPPVVGWLVCVKGENLGSDYRLRPGRNALGREVDNEIQITGDGQISRQAHAVVFFDHRKQEFHLYSDQGSNGTWLNDDIVLQNARQLQARDRILIGETELLFIPLCGPDFDWASR